MPGPTATLDVRLKRAYEVPADSDGTRVLIDRLWPRGVSKATARIDHWFREIAPSTTLRQWFGHDPVRWAEFQQRYAAELDGQGELLEQLRALAARGPLTLVYGARDVEHNDAVVLQRVLLGDKATPRKGTVKASKRKASKRKASKRKTSRRSAAKRSLPQRKASRRTTPRRNSRKGRR